MGSGSGLHTLSLAKLGYKTVAVDLCNELLEETRQHAAELSLNGKVDVLHGDLMQPSTWGLGEGELCSVVSCMGDTLSHLGSVQEMEAFLAASLTCLKEDGVLLVSFRDQQTKLIGPARCLPVRSSPTRIHTCFLEFAPAYITVNDIFHEFDTETQAWTQHVGGFAKLRITTPMVTTALVAAGYAISSQQTFRGMVYIAAQPSQQPAST